LLLRATERKPALARFVVIHSPSVNGSSVHRDPSGSPGGRRGVPSRGRCGRNLRAIRSKPSGRRRGQGRGSWCGGGRAASASGVRLQPPPLSRSPGVRFRLARVSDRVAGAPHSFWVLGGSAARLRIDGQGHDPAREHAVAAASVQIGTLCSRVGARLAGSLLGDIGTRPDGPIAIPARSAGRVTPRRGMARGVLARGRRDRVADPALKSPAVVSRSPRAFR
jgi:hypothetical protein